MNHPDTLIYESAEKENLPVLADTLLTYHPDCRVFLLRGNLGAGKTTMVKAFCEKLGYAGHVNSPTFSIINQYEANGEPVYHMDLYRLESPEEAFEIGIEDYLHSGHYCFIEWPDIIVPYLYLPYTEIFIENTGDSARKITAVWYPGEKL